MENTLRAIKRRLKIRTHKFQEGDHYNGHIRIEEFQGKVPDISRHEEASTVQIAQLVATQPRHAQGLLSGASGDKVEHKSIREENGAAKPLEPTTSSQTKSAINVRKSRIGTSIFTEKSANKPPKELVDRLSHAMLRSAFKENRRYIPEGKLDLLIHRSSIRKDLRSAYNKQRPPWDRLRDARKAYKLASLICPSPGLKIASMGIASRSLDQKKLEYRKIYAILLLVGQATSISDFVKYAISDQELPLVRCEVSEEHKQRFKCSHSLACQSKPNSVIPCFCSWGEQDTQDFEEKQWRVLAPIFNDYEDEAISHKDLEDACVLPFRQWTCSAKGGTACIYMAEIHDNHHRFSRTRKHSDVFAVKQLLNPVRVGLQQRDLPYEINVLKGILKPLHQNNHLINILASFRIEGIDYIILPWAQSDLLGYWRCENPSPSPSIRTVKWLLEQCHGLACALRNIHRWPTYTNSRLYHVASSNRTNGGEHQPLVLFGCHGDIKPENILWLDNGGLGILKLADFGTARFDAEGTPSPVNLDVPTTPGYRPPESDSATTISSSWDIWGLGCVYLEFVTWLSNGWTGVDTFTRDRLAPDHNQKYSPMNTTTFYEVPKRDSPSPRLKPVVNEHLEKVSGKLPHPVVLERFLDYIMERMVIVESQTAKRSNAAEVVQKTEEILNAFAKATNRRGRMGSLKDKLHI